MHEPDELDKKTKMDGESDGDKNGEELCETTLWPTQRDNAEYGEHNEEANVLPRRYTPKSKTPKEKELEDMIRDRGDP